MIHFYEIKCSVALQWKAPPFRSLLRDRTQSSLRVLGSETQREEAALATNVFCDFLSPTAGNLLA